MEVIVGAKGAALVGPPRCADVVVEELVTLGVDRVFGVPGGEVLVLMDALRSAGIEYVVCHHESGAGVMAAVYGKSRGTVGVVLTTLGPGAANLMFPLAQSALDREPLLAISAVTPSSWHRARTHQKLPILESYAHVAKYVGELTPTSCQGVMRAAGGDALAEPAGPSLVTLSADHASAPAEVANAADGNDGRKSVRPEGSVEQAAATVRRRLAESERPLVVIGVGVEWGASPALRSWLADWGLAVAVTPKAKGMVDDASTGFIGVIGGMAIDSRMSEALAHADLIVGVGLDPTEIDGDWHLELPVLWLLASEWATGESPELDVVWAEHDALFAAMGAPFRAWQDEFSDVRSYRSKVYADAAAAPMTPVGLVAALADVMPSETVVTTDVGSHKYVFGQFWPTRDPGTFFMSNGLSGMGYGLPAAIGAKLARPELPVLAVLGDGGFAMNSSELETACRLGIGLIVVVLADKSFSLIRVGQEKRGLERFGVDFGRIDAAMVARACGVHGVQAQTRAEVAAAVSTALDSGEVTVIEVPIDATDYRGIV